MDTEMAKVFPRTKEKDVRTSEIEQAARQVFISRGYRTATIQEIAEKAGIAKGTVYLYYKGKEDLYTALMLPSLEYLNSRLQGLLDQVEKRTYRTGKDLMHALADLFLDLHYRDPEMAMIYQTFQIGSFFTDVSDDVLTQLSSCGKKNFELLRKLWKRGIDLGLLKESDIIRSIDALWGLFIGVAQIEWNKLTWSKKDHLRDTLHHAFSLMCSGVCLVPSKKRSGQRKRD
jgi:AcrR family transcriptional regulator